MLKNRKIGCFLTFMVMFLGFFSFPINAQNHLNSPYSRFAMGDMSVRTSGTVLGMGGVGYAFQSATAINFANPAAYIAFDTLSCLVEGAFSIKTHTLRTGAISQKGSTVYIDYLSIGISATKWWKIVIGYQPFTHMTYDVADYDTIATIGAYETHYTGSGGLNEIYWGNAFRLYKGLSIGINTSFIFGKYEKSRTMNFENANAVSAKFDGTNRIKGFYLTAGLQYMIPIKDKWLIGLGMVYTPPLKFWNKSVNLTTTYLGNINALSPTLLDTLYPQDELKKTYQMPQSIGAGFSWAKSNKFHIEANFTWTNWSQYKDGGNADTTLTDAYKFALGGSITPKYNSSNYLARITFSVGANYELTRLMLINTQIDKFGINFGIVFPLKKSKTCLGVILEYGQLGTTKKDLIQENYFTVMFNVRLHEKWYQRIKLD